MVLLHHALGDSVRRPDHRLRPRRTPARQQQGKYQVTNIPLPADISTRVANQPNFYGSLIKETLNWSKVSVKVKGKTVFNNVSVGCQNGKRPWSITYTATTEPAQRPQTSDGQRLRRSADRSLNATLGGSRAFAQLPPGRHLRP